MSRAFFEPRTRNDIVSMPGMMPVMPSSGVPDAKRNTLNLRIKPERPD
jgi:hypothetical protein